MADADPFESETTDFPDLIGCSFLWEINLDLILSLLNFLFLHQHILLFSFHLIICCFSLASLLTRTYTHTHTNTQTWQSVGVRLSGFWMSCNCMYHLQHSFSVKAFSCSTEACCSIVIQQCHTCDTHTLLPVDHSLLLPSHLHQGLVCCHYDT